jgi:hypothetical protein
MMLTLLEGSFYRAAVPQDVLQGNPNPLLWGIPSAWLDPSGCNPLTFFANHSIIFGLYISFGSFIT